MQVTYAYTYTTHSETKKWPPCKGSNISRVVYIYPICPLAPAIARRILFYLCDYCQINHRPELQVSMKGDSGRRILWYHAAYIPGG